MNLLEWANNNLKLIGHNKSHSYDLVKFENCGIECPACLGYLDINEERFTCNHNLLDCSCDPCDVKGNTIDELKKFIKRGKKIISYANGE